MMATVGRCSQFAFVIGSADPNRRGTQYLPVDIYAAGRWLTCDDRDAHVPTFTHHLRSTLDVLLSDRPPEQWRRPYPDLSAADNHRRVLELADAGDNAPYLAYTFMNWGETTDNVQATLFIEEGVALIPCSFRRADHHDPSELGKVFVADLPVRELIRVLHGAAWEIAERALAPKLRLPT